MTLADRLGPARAIRQELDRAAKVYAETKSPELAEALYGLSKAYSTAVDAAIAAHLRESGQDYLRLA